MRYVRFMGIDELRKYFAGETLRNHTIWSETSGTKSVGFCFFDELVSPEKRLEYLTGVVDLSLVAVFERLDSMPMRIAQGRYRNPDKDMKDGNILELLLTPPVTMRVKEYSTTEYSKESMKLVKVGRPLLGFGAKHEIKWLGGI